MRQQRPRYLVEIDGARHHDYRGIRLTKQAAKELAKLNRGVVWQHVTNDSTTGYVVIADYRRETEKPLRDGGYDGDTAA